MTFIRFTPAIVHRPDGIHADPEVRRSRTAHQGEGLPLLGDNLNAHFARDVCAR